MFTEKIFFLIFLIINLINTVHGQMSFVLKSYTVSPNYAKSTSSLYTFSFNAFNTNTGVVDLKITFPNQY